MTQFMRDLSASLADLIETAAPGILRVEARRRLPASGIAWSDELIVTAHHVVERDDDIHIGLPDGERIAATLIGRDPRNDLALLKVEGGLTAADWAEDDSLRVGEMVLAAARPRRHVRAALGIVSGIVAESDMQRRRKRIRATMQKGRRKDGRRARFRMEGFGDAINGGWLAALGDGLIQVDATMYPGFSGGPLIGADGKAHGMMTSGFMRGSSMAAPVASLRRALPHLLASGKIQRGWLGIGVQPARLPDKIAQELDQAQGLLIVSLEPASPADAANLLVGDILTALDETAIESVEDLQLLLAQHAIGRQTTVGFVRGGMLSQGSVAVGAR